MRHQRFIAIFRDTTTQVEVYDKETQLSKYFDSVGAMLNAYPDLGYVTIKTI